jgi:hypothetical protein
VLQEWKGAGERRILASMNYSAALKALVKVGLKVFAPGMGEILTTIAEEGSSLIIDAHAARRAADIHGRILRKVESAFERFATTERLTADEAGSTIELSRAVIATHGIQSGEWATAGFDAPGAESLVLARAEDLLVTVSPSEKSRVAGLLRAYYGALLADEESIKTLEAEFRASVLAGIEQLSQKISNQPAENAKTSIAAAAAALVSIPVQRWRAQLSPPGALLRADIEGGVPFHNRDSELADIESWRDLPNRVGLRLYVGPGGLGKTRLMIQACWGARCAGWQAGFVSNRGRLAPAAVWDAITRARPNSMLVLDYAETRSTELVELARASIDASAQHRIRLILVARHAGDWWRELKATTGATSDLLYSSATSDPIRLRPVVSKVEERAKAYALALKTFGERLSAPVAGAEQIDFAAPYFDRILLLHMQALASVEGVTITGDRGLLDYVLSRERRFWARLAVEREIPVYLSGAIAQMMAVVTLGGGLRTEQDAFDVAKTIPTLADQSAAIQQAVVTILHEAYPGEHWIEPVLPDLLGEHLVQAELNDTLTRLVFDSTASRLHNG